MNGQKNIKKSAKFCKKTIRRMSAEPNTKSRQENKVKTRICAIPDKGTKSGGGGEFDTFRCVLSVGLKFSVIIRTNGCHINVNLSRTGRSELTRGQNTCFKIVLRYNESCKRNLMKSCQCKAGATACHKL